jgi:hypothetical protein
MSKQRLRELYNEIEKNEFRTKGIDKDKYTELLYELADRLYYELNNDPKYSYAKEMIHDFNWAIRNLKLHHIDLCLKSIREYISYDRITYFFTYYDGVNIYSSMNRLRDYVFFNGKYYPQFSVYELNNIIKEIEEYRELNPNAKHIEESIYSLAKLNYYKNML